MEKDDLFWLNVAYMVTAALAVYIFWMIFNTVGIETNWQQKYESWYLPLKHIGSIVLGVITVVILRRDREKHEYYLNSVNELRKVSWPSFEDTKRMTLVVCWVVAIFSGILFVFDSTWSFLLKLIIA